MTKISHKKDGTPSPEDLAISALDLDFYYAFTDRAFNNQRTAYEHYRDEGWVLEFDPSPTFSTRKYLQGYPDVASAKVNPLLHYFMYGIVENRQIFTSDAQYPSPIKSTPAESIDPLWCVREAFNPEFYLEKSPDLVGANIDLFDHYIKYGWKELRNPSPDFNTEQYLLANPDVSKSGDNPFIHWILTGQKEGRPISPLMSGEPASKKEVSDDALENGPAGGKEDGGGNLDIKLFDEFDAEYYRKENTDLIGSDLELFSHYMNHGWKEHRNPSKKFDTGYYLAQNTDIRDAGVNPFTHYIQYGRGEARVAVTYSAAKENLNYKPLVSIIVPNYNHARFLKERIRSIQSQTYDNIELIVLDDCSTDNSREVIDSLLSEADRPFGKIFNEVNSGGVFYQWQKGIAASSGEIIWICESDDTCDSKFLENLVRYFADPSVMIAFGRIQFCDASGKIQDGLDGYREATESGIWDKPCVRPAAKWFRGAFAISNIIPNVGGCLMRKQPIESYIWDTAKQFRISADWYLYMMLSRGGRIAYDPDAVAYFRQHGKNTSVTGFLRKEYYSEHERVAVEVRRNWGSPVQSMTRLYSNVVCQYEYVKAEEHVGPLEDLISISKILRTKRERKHVLIAFLGFHLGGGELFPINLANTLLKQNLNVSVLALDSNDINKSIRGLLDPRIPVYEAQLVQEIGVNQFIESAGIDLIHSHAVALEFFFYQKNRLEKRIPYLVSLHGSYEVTPLPDDLLLRIIKGVDHWFFLAEKNLVHLKEIPLNPTKFTRVRNGMPIDNREFDFDRAALGIAPDAFVFGIASRAILAKGWLQAASALKVLSAKLSRPVALCLCGEGSDFDEIKKYIGDDQNVKLLGYQDKIHGFYRIIDCAMLPSRFKGESFPLALIQAMQVGVPIISTRVGEIPSMLDVDGEAAGLLVDPVESDIDFVELLAGAMEAIMDSDTWQSHARISKKFGEGYSIDSVTENYLSYFDKYYLSE